jgi:hypothetical protein
MRILNHIVIIVCFLLSASVNSFSQQWIRNSYTHPTLASSDTGIAYDGALLWDWDTWVTYESDYTGHIHTYVEVDSWFIRTWTLSKNVNAKVWDERFQGSSSTPPTQSWDWYGIAMYYISVYCKNDFTNTVLSDGKVRGRIQTEVENDSDNSGLYTAEAKTQNRTFDVGFGLRTGFTITLTPGVESCNQIGTLTSCSAHSTTTDVGPYRRIGSIDQGAACGYFLSWYGSVQADIDISFIPPN